MNSLPLLDRLSRPLGVLRISVTDRCNFRCRYCMPREHFDKDFRFLPKAEILSFEETARLARLFAGLGVRTFRITGGEPLLRKDVAELVRLLAAIPDTETALTTNGSLLRSKASALRDSGLARLTVSLDALDERTFQRMNDVNFPVAEVLSGIDAASAVGFRPVKINAVVRRGTNEHSVLDLVRHFKPRGHIVRFIEYMDVGTTNGWQRQDVFSASDIFETIHAEFPMHPVEQSNSAAVANRYRFRDGSGEVGIIASVTQPFCRGCNRARLSAEGKLYPCLFAAHGLDLRHHLRSGASDTEIVRVISDFWQNRDDRYSELRFKGRVFLPRAEMSYLGG